MGMQRGECLVLNPDTTRPAKTEMMEILAADAVRLLTEQKEHWRLMMPGDKAREAVMSGRPEICGGAEMGGGMDSSMIETVA